jgi:NAD(P)-dependent dehydrogenase (short-subunit alcohol dehydrogenase family)
MSDKNIIISGTVIITGGTRGIGRACVLKLSELGYDIVFTWSTLKTEAIALQNEIRLRGVHCTAIELQLENDDIEEKFLEIDNLISSPIIGLVNNAAIDGGRDNFTVKNRNDWIHIFQVNVFGLMDMSREVYKRMAISCGGKGGSIVNLTSQVATFGSNKLLAYTASKGAVNSITLSLSKEIGHEKIRVNAVSPGLIDMNQDSKVLEFHKSRVEQIPLGRLGTPSDVSELVSWLISEDSAFINGVIIPVHGGR